MNQPINNSVSDSPGYIVSVQLNQLDWLAMALPLLISKKTLFWLTTRAFRMLVSKASCRNPKCLFTPLASDAVKGRTIKIFKSWTSEMYILVRMVMGRELDLIVCFSVNSPTAFIISTVVFTIQLSLIGGPRKGILLGAALSRVGVGDLLELGREWEQGDLIGSWRNGSSASWNGTQEMPCPETHHGNWIEHREL